MNRLRTAVVVAVVVAIGLPLAYIALGAVTLVYAETLVVPAVRTHDDLKYFPDDTVERFEDSRLIGWKTRDRRVYAGIFVGYKYQRCGPSMACLRFRCVGLDVRKDVVLTPGGAAFPTRRCLGVVLYLGGGIVN